MGAQQVGGSLREALVSVWKQTGVKPDELLEIECPDAMHHIWGWFVTLNSTRSHGMSINPISFQDIWAWSQLTENEPTPFEVDCITSLDDLFLKTRD